MQEEEIGKNIITSIEEKDYKTIVLTNEDKYVIYSLFFDNEKYTQNCILSKEEVEYLTRQNKLTKILEYCLKILRKKFLSSGEIRVKLMKKFDDKELVDVALKMLLENKVLDDKKYIQTALILFEDAMYGKYFIIDYFKKKGIDEKIIKEIEFDPEKEKAKALAYFLSFKNMYVSSNTLKAKKKLSETLLSRGFELGIINQLVSDLKVDPEIEHKLLAKDGNKLFSKYSKKYQGFELKNKIITGLIKIGYEYKDIENFLNEGGLIND